MMRLQKLQVYLTLFLLLIVLTHSVLASPPNKVKGKVMKHFDQNKDGLLSRYEFSLYETHKHFAYPLAKKNKQKAYDVNGNLMLEPYEFQLFQQDKKKGSLKKYKKNPVIQHYQRVQ